jgi:hypothetical protein
LYDELEASGGRGGGPLAIKTVSNVHRLLHKSLNDAVREGRLARNPAGLVQPPSAPKAQKDVWSVEQLRRIPMARRRRPLLRRVAAVRDYQACVGVK